MSLKHLVLNPKLNPPRKSSNQNEKETQKILILKLEEEI